LREDVEVAIDTKAKLKDYLCADETAEGHWKQGCQKIYSIKDFVEGSSTEATITLQQIELADKHLWQFGSPVSSAKFCHSRSIQRTGYS
jgi:hypothetical protein